MKKEVVEFESSSFEDYSGMIHKFTVAAVSTVFEAKDKKGKKVVPLKSLSLGWAICNPLDRYNEEIACRIAEGRAKKSKDNAVITFNLGLINHTTVLAFISSQIQHIQNFPEKYIIGYAEKEEAYNTLLSDMRTDLRSVGYPEQQISEILDMATKAYNLNPTNGEQAMEEVFNKYYSKRSNISVNLCNPVEYIYLPFIVQTKRTASNGTSSQSSTRLSKYNK